MKTHTVHASQLAPIRKIDEGEFNWWMDKFHVSMLYSEKEAEETRKRHPFLINGHIPSALEKLTKGK